jgi:uncharacterized peroxidase-related enzyme
VYIETVSEETATGETAVLYEQERERIGSVTNFVRAFSARPEVYRAWRQLNIAVQSSMDLRRFELATLAAARELRSSYCALAHGKVLAEQFYDAPTVVGLPDGLDETDAAIMEVAAKVARDATTVGPEDVDRLRSLGLGDDEILDVVLAAAVRCFFSKTLDAVGAEPDATFMQLDPLLRESLTVGRPIEA